jgi:very-short-patch-repair endonuclease
MTSKNIDLARTLRKNATDAETVLWQCLRRRSIKGCRFKRQQPIGDYIVDFVCLSKKLVVEVDGGQHVNNIKDEIRDKWLKNKGFDVLRFWDNDVLVRTEDAAEAIYNKL